MSRNPRRTSVAAQVVARLAARLRPGEALVDPLADGVPLTREARVFEAALRTASLSLVAEPLPPAARLGVVVSRDEAGGRRRLAAMPLLAGLAAVMVAVSLVQILPRGSLGGAGSSVPGALPSAPGATSSASAVAASPAPPATGSATPSQAPSASARLAPTPVPSASPSAPCTEAFTVAVKAWSGAGMGQITTTSLDKATLPRAVGALGKVFVVCSPAELRAVNASLLVPMPVKVPGSSSVRYVSTQLFADVDGVARLLCRAGTLATTRTCVIELATPLPAASGSP